MKNSIKILMLIGLFTLQLTIAYAGPGWIEIDCSSSSYHQSYLVNLKNLVAIERTGDTTLRLSYYGYRSVVDIECDSRYHTDQVYQELMGKIK